MASRDVLSAQTSPRRPESAAGLAGRIPTSVRALEPTMRFAVTLAIWALLATSASSQQSAGLSELEPLERFIGSWSYEGEDLTPGGGAVRCTSIRQWTAAGFFVESRRRCTTPRGELQQLEVYGYDYSGRVYRYWGFNGQFVSTYSTPAIEGGSISWDSIAFPGRYRCSETFAPALTESTTKCESSTDGGVTWTVIARGSSRRTAP